MQMTDAEIVRSYKQADPKKKVEQIRILSELNACDKKTIREILEKNGCNPPKYGNRYTGKVKKDGELKIEQTDEDLVKGNTNLVKEDVENADTKGISGETVSQSLVKDGDLISRQAVIDIVKFECGEWKGLTKTIVKGIEQLPSAEKTAEWKKISPAGIYECTNCECWSDDKTRYCPTCGRRMKGVEK